MLDAAAPGLKEIDVYESRAHASDVLRSLTAPLQNGNRVPEVISASLGTCEPALQLSIGDSGIRAAEGALALAAASGISVLASAATPARPPASAATVRSTALAVSFPASSPYVTGVGGTNIELNAANQIAAQIVWNDAPYNLAAGGGGVSRLFSRPSYQKGFLPSNRRGVPDVSMLADVLPGYDIYCTAADCARAGAATRGSRSAARARRRRCSPAAWRSSTRCCAQHQKQNLGVANSLLYRIARQDAAAGVFSDVTGSDNDLGPYLPGGNHRPLGCCSAAPGYDLATGLGSVDLAKLALLATADQPAIAKVGLSLPGQRPLAQHHLRGPAHLLAPLHRPAAAPDRDPGRPRIRRQLEPASAAQAGLAHGGARASPRASCAAITLRAARATGGSYAHVSARCSTRAATSRRTDRPCVSPARIRH